MHEHELHGGWGCNFRAEDPTKIDASQCASRSGGGGLCFPVRGHKYSKVGSRRRNLHIALSALYRTRLCTVKWYVDVCTYPLYLRYGTSKSICSLVFFISGLWSMYFHKELPSRAIILQLVLHTRHCIAIPPQRLLYRLDRYPGTIKMYTGIEKNFYLNSDQKKVLSSVLSTVKLIY